MKKEIGIISGILSYFILVPQVFADNVCPRSSTFSALCIESKDIGQVVGNAITYIFILATILALGYLIWGGIKWLISGGDKTALEEARNHIIAAIIGLAIIFLSYFILNLIIGFFVPGFSIGNFQLPEIKAP